MQWGAWAGSGMAVTHNLLPRIINSGACISLKGPLQKLQRADFSEPYASLIGVS